MKYVLYLDPSLRYFGLSIVGHPLNQKRSPKLVHSECIQTQSTMKDVESMNRISSRLKEIFGQWKIDRVVCEAFIGSKSARAAKSLGYVQGVVVGMCTALDIPCTYVSAMSIKKRLTGSKSAEKDEVLDAILKIFPNLADFMKGKNKEIRWAMSDSCALFAES